MTYEEAIDEYRDDSDIRDELKQFTPKINEKMIQKVI